MTVHPKLAPSILAADFWNLGAAIEHVLPYADMIHVDVMDGRFVPNITMGNVVIEALKKHCDAFIDCHLMAVEPHRHFKSLVASGADSISFHAEASRDIGSDVAALKGLGCRASVAVSPGTAVETTFPFLEELDMVVVMSVEPGFAGQAFIPSALDKLRALRREVVARRLSLEIQVDGGIKPSNVGEAAEAGATVFVAASALFGAPDPGAAARQLRDAAAAGMARCPFLGRAGVEPSTASGGT